MRRDPRARRVLVVAFIVASAGAAGCDAPTLAGEAPAYDPTALTGGRIYHWPLGATVRVHVAESRDGTALAPLVRAAADAWVATLAYRELAVRLVDDAGVADVVVAHAAAHPVELAACGGFGIGAAFTLLCPAADSARVLPLRSGAPSAVRVAVAIDEAQLTSPAQLAAVVTHEVGHALGVGGHSDDSADVMFADPRVARPSADDARTLRYVLHRPVALRLR